MNRAAWLPRLARETSWSSQSSSSVGFSRSSMVLSSVQFCHALSGESARRYVRSWQSPDACLQVTRKVSSRSCTYIPPLSTSAERNQSPTRDGSSVFNVAGHGKVSRPCDVGTGEEIRYLHRLASAVTSSALPICRRVCKVANECQLTLDADEYMNSFSPTIMDLVASWAQGARFLDILKSSGILEVRCSGMTCSSAIVG